MYLCWSGNFWQREYLVENFAFVHSCGKTQKEQILSLPVNVLLCFFFHMEMMTNCRALWDMCLSCTLEHFLILCPLLIYPSRLLSEDTNFKKLTHGRNPLRWFGFFFFPPSPTQIASAWRWREAKILDEWQTSWLWTSDVLWPCRDGRKGTAPLITRLGTTAAEPSCFKVAEEGEFPCACAEARGGETPTLAGWQAAFICNIWRHRVIWCFVLKKLLRAVVYAKRVLFFFFFFSPSPRLWVLDNWNDGYWRYCI